MRFHIVVVSYASWLLSILLVFYLSHGKGTTGMQIAFLCGLVPSALQLFLIGIDWRGLVAPVKMWLSLLLIILLGYVLSNFSAETATRSLEAQDVPPAWIPLVYTFDVAFMVGISTLVAGCPDRRLLRSIAGCFCILCAPFLVYVDITGERTWGDRLVANHLEPVWWGLMGLTVCLAAFAGKPGFLAIAGFVAGAATIFASNAREDILAVSVCLLIVMISYLRTMKRSQHTVMLAGICLTLVSAMLFLPQVIHTFGFIGHDVLSLDNPARGIGSGFTGRTGIWQSAAEVWFKHPFFGVGFRQNEQYLGGYSTHNAYLAMLVDTGLVGFVWFLILLGSSLFAALGIQDQRTRLFVMTFVVANVAIGFFDRRVINPGTPYGLFFVMCCSVALTDRSLRKFRAATDVFTPAEKQLT
ncbi:MAG TPA: O-antigen ligase family protein [Stellaceae bacterium]|nr:O-antigen ligase family protein [Stellaceae bacterium]